MTRKSRLLATALAISLSTPAAAVTISLTDRTATFQIVGDFTMPAFSLLASASLSPAPPALLERYAPLPGEPIDPTKIEFWEYHLEVRSLMPMPFEPGGVVSSGCYTNFRFCFPDVRPTGPITVNVGDILRFDYFWGGSIGFSPIPRPELLLGVTLPEGVALSQTPLPAAWVMFASVLGLAGWLGWRRSAAA